MKRETKNKALAGAFIAIFITVATEIVISLIKIIGALVREFLRFKM